VHIMCTKLFLWKEYCTVKHYCRCVYAEEKYFLLDYIAAKKLQLMQVNYHVFYMVNIILWYVIYSNDTEPCKFFWGVVSILHTASTICGTMCGSCIFERPCSRYLLHSPFSQKESIQLIFFSKLRYLKYSKSLA
jgi:hypothetical protein